MTEPITLYEMSIVFVGQNHNPSLLNSDFLWRHHIVPDDMPLARDVPVFSTPMVSNCAFQNGLNIHSEPERILFTVPILEENDAEKSRFLCHTAAERYLRVVSLVNYVAVGINFSGFFADRGGEVAPHNLLRTGKWTKFENISPVANIALAYKTSKRDINLTIKSDIIPEFGNKQKVVARGNFHHAIRAKQGESHKAAIAIVDEWKNDLDSFKILTANVHKGMQK